MRGNNMSISKSIDAMGVIGLFFTALCSPCCFPLFAFGASALGLGSFELFGGWTMWVFQAMVIISIIGLYFSYQKHHCAFPLILAGISGLFIFYGYYFIQQDYWIYLIYIGMAGLLFASLWNYHRNKLHNKNMQMNEFEVQLNSTITCPQCGHTKMETMPTNACVYYYECENCKTRLKPNHGDCCVFCSFGTVKCPPIQKGNGCC
jgi:hypothetical protein